MLSVDRRFTDLHSIVDDVHDLFEWWREEALAAGALDEFSIEVMKLAVHEWVANLVQHAHFRTAAPMIKLSIIPDGARVRCTIDDNSRGFDFMRQIAKQHHDLGAAEEPPERGRGLLLMIACTQNLSYRPLPEQDKASLPRLHRLEFWVAPGAGANGAPGFSDSEAEEFGLPQSSDTKEATIHPEPHSSVQEI